MANENSIDVYHALMALEEKVTGVAPDPENVTTDVALALSDIFRTDAPMAQETAIVNAIDTITANYGGGGGGGDFTTASVVFSLDGYTGAPFTLHAPYTFYNGVLSETVIDCDIDSSEMDGETAFDLVMYHGKLYIEAPNGIFSAATGDIDITESFEATITGDGTLTISDEP